MADVLEKRTKKSKIGPNSVSLAGEFAVLSQLALRGYDANMTLGNTKRVDILVSHPRTLKMFQLEVKTNFKSERKKPRQSKIHGVFLSDWIMHKEHETVTAANLFYCFVNIGRNTNSFKFYIVPSKVVAKYVREEHALWLKVSKKIGKKVKDTICAFFGLA
jgi:hypothetical protein